MSATLSTIIFSGTLLAVHLLSRTPSPPFQPDKNFSDTLKGVAMLMILYHHSGIYHSTALWFFYGAGWGFCGVSLFFFISGFGLMKSHANHPYSPGDFFKKRVWTLVPTIMLCMLARYLFNPLMVKHFPFPADLFTLTGLHEWYIIALFSWYLLFILLIVSFKVSYSPFVFPLAALFVWGLLAIFSPASQVPQLWIRFPFSFALGVVCGYFCDPIIYYFQRRLVAISLISGIAVCMVCNLPMPLNQIYPLLDLLILPAGICIVIWIYRLDTHSKFIQFTGRNSLPLYLVQVPLIKYGIFMNVWRDDISGLLATWAVIFLVSMMISYIRPLMDAGIRYLSRTLRVHFH